MPASAIVAPGHNDSVLYLEVLPSYKLLASGGEDGAICFTDLATLKPAGRIDASSLGDAVPALCAHPADDHALFAAAGSSVLHLDLRRGLDASAALHCYAVNADEVNSLAASAANGGWLATGDDAGEVQVIALGGASSSGSGSGAAAAAAAAASDSGGAGTTEGAAAGAAPAALPRPERPAAYKTLRRGHSNICSAVAFRPHRPWELLSGGLDSTVVRWDFSRLRPLQSWSLAGEATASGGQLLNPPMVHSLAVPQTEDRALCRLMAVGRGDGYVALYDADWKPAAAGSSGSSGGGSAGGGKKAGKARQRGGGGGGGSASGSARQAVAPGRLALLGREQGGHMAAVNSVAFYPAGGPSLTRMLSAGNDCRLLLWDLTAAQEQAAAAAAETAGEAAAEPGGSSLRQGGGQEQAAAAAAGEEGSGPQQLLAADVRHARKINAARPAAVPGCPYDVFIADTGRRLTALALA